MQRSPASTPYTVLVNSCDGFRDCWQPFFALFGAQWPGCAAPVMLNTERAEWAPAAWRPGSFTCTRVHMGVDDRRMTWSECLAAALAQVETPLVLYMQEDYFLDRPVQGSVVDDLAATMVGDPRIRHIGLTHFGSHGPFAPTADDRLWRISRTAKYRVSTQAGLWRVDTLRDLLRSRENGWMFEIYGTRRSRRSDELFLTVNRDRFNASRTPVINYTLTGIIKGRWHPAIPPLLAEHGITLDFQQRGFYKEKPWLTRKIETARTLLSDPAGVLPGLIGRS